MKKYFMLLILLMIVFISNNQVKAQSYPQWYCMSHDEIIWDIAFHNNIAWIATRGGLVKYDRVTGATTFYNAANSPLYANETTSLEVDDSGNVWIGTYCCDLLKFDGVNWTHFTSINGVDTIPGVFDLQKDRNGNLIIGTGYGIGKSIYKYDGANFINLNCPSQTIYSISIDTSNNIWCGAYCELLKYDGANWTTYDSTNSPITFGIIISTSVDNSNNVWISLSENSPPQNHKIYYLNDTTWTYVDTLVSGIPLTSNTRLTSDDSGNVYFYGQINGIKKFDGTGFTDFSQVTLGINSPKIEKLFIDSAFHFWIWTDYIGDTLLYEFDGIQTIGHYASNSMINSSTYNFLDIDHEGNRWFCSDYDGIQKFDGFNWTKYNQSNSNICSNNIYNVAFDNNNTAWISNAESPQVGPPLSSFDGNTWTNYWLSFTGTTPGAWKVIADKFNNIWVEIWSLGVAKYDGTNWTYWNKQSLGIPLFYVIDIALDDSGNVWAAAYSSGLAKFSNGSWTFFDTTNSNLPSNYVTSVFVDHLNNVWITDYDRLCKFDGSTFYDYGAFNDSIEGNPWCVAEDHLNNIWIGTSNGLTKYDGSTWTNYNKYNSGVCYNIYGIKIDKNNTKWISGIHGVWLFNENGITPQDWHNVPQTKFEGKIFYDENSNGQCDTTTDLGMINQKVICLNDSAVTYSNSQGIYRFYRDSGFYESSFIPYANWNVTSDSLSYQVAIDTSSVFGLDYGTYSPYPYNALEINLTAGSSRCNATIPFWIEYHNTGTNISTGSITFIKHDSLALISSNPAPTAVSGDTMMWSYNNLLPFESRSIILGIKNPDVNSINDTLLSYITITDTTGATDSGAVTQIITCAYDPNDKSVEPVGLTPQHLTHIGDSLEYTIRFQNLGNDTAFSVYIIDSVPPAMEKDSFQFLASSHPADIEISKTGVIRFMFNNIMLPPMSANEPASMGYVKYRLKPKQNLPNNTEVRNTAYIYFDLNPAVVTNTVSNIYSTAPAGVYENRNEFSLIAYPNPFDNLLWIQLKKIVSSESVVAIYDATGRTVFQKEFQSSLIPLKLQSLSPGIYFVSVKNGNLFQRFKVVKY